MADYNINAVTRRVVYDGSSGLGPYAFNFEVLDANDINVYFNTTLLTITDDYTVTVNANGKGSVSIVTGTNVPSTPVAADQITIIGSRDIERTTDFVTAGDLRAAALNEQLDALTIFDQQISERVDRSVQFPSYEPAGLNYTVPDVDDRKGKYLAFDNNGELTSTAGTTSDIVVSSFGGTLIDDVNASAARTTLGLGSVATLSSIATANITDANVTTAKIADNAVTNAKMADDSVGANELIDNSVGAAAINIVGNGSSGQAIVSDADGSFSYKTLANQAFQGTTGTLVGSGLTEVTSVNITPTSTSAKILILASMFDNINSTEVDIEIQRDSTVLTGSLRQASFQEISGAGTNLSRLNSLATFWLDEPNTTSQINYKLMSDVACDNANIIAIEISS
jgi:hypothetical protein